MTDHPVRPPAGPASDPFGVMGLALALARFLLAAEFLTYGVRKFLHPENIYRLIEAHHLRDLVYLVIPWQVGFTRCLEALLLNVGDPLLTRHQTIESIRLEDAERKYSCDTTCNQT